MALCEGHALQVCSGIQLSVPTIMMSPRMARQQGRALDWRRHMRNIVDEAGEIIAKATDDRTLIGGHLRTEVGTA
jgi:hypothetical protein